MNGGRGGQFSAAYGIFLSLVGIPQRRLQMTINIASPLASAAKGLNFHLMAFAND
jgi:hypothetical protein